MTNWHIETIERFKTMDNDMLLYIRQDAYNAAKAGETIDNPKAGQYWDEFPLCLPRIEEAQDYRSRI